MKIYEKEINQAIKEIKKQFKKPLIIDEWGGKFEDVYSIIMSNCPSDLNKSLQSINNEILEIERTKFFMACMKKLSDHININL